MPRKTHPREPVSVAPSFVSQLTCTQILGIDPRRYLDLLLPLCKSDVVQVGKLRLVELRLAVDVLRSLAAQPVDERRGDLPRQPETLEEIMAELGMEFVTDETTHTPPKRK